MDYSSYFKFIWTIRNTKQKNWFVASIHGEATFITLNNNAYWNKFGRDNPNLNLINQLKENGVELYVCSQPTASRKINNKDLNINLISALSGIAVLSKHLLQGFTLMPN